MTKRPDPGPPVKIALTPTTFAMVSTIDWGHVYYQGEWNLVGKNAKCKGVLLGPYVAGRMGLDLSLSVAYADGNPLNCTRENVFVTQFSWTTGIVKTYSEGPEKTTIENENDAQIFGNVALIQFNGSWCLIHCGSGRYVGASWSKLKAAKAGTEAIHAERNLSELDKHETFNLMQQKRWRTLIAKHREK